MEDAHITLSPFTESKGKKNHLFAVFDGHGGTETVTQVHKLLHSSLGTLQVNFKATGIIRTNNTKKL